MNAGLQPSAATGGVESAALTRADLWRGLRWGLIAAYVVVLAASVVTNGLPLDRAGITLWAFAAVLVVSVGRPIRTTVQAIVDWLPFTVALFAYDYTRGLADTLGLPVHYTEPIDADRLLFGGTLPTAWLQEHLYTPGESHWYDVLVTLTYISHFFSTFIVAVVLWARNRPRFRAWVGCWLAMAFLGVTTYVLYPMSPPWLAHQEGLIPETVNRISGIGWGEIGLGVAGRALSIGQNWSNQVAAMPSLHAGYAALVVGFFMVGASWSRRLLLSLYPLAMGLALVYSGEHYVVDVLAGYAYAFLIIAVWQWLRRRRLKRARLDRGPLCAEPQSRDPLGGQPGEVRT